MYCIHSISAPTSHEGIEKVANVLCLVLLPLSAFNSKFLTMSTEFEEKPSKLSDHKNYIKIFFEHLPSKLLDPQKSTFGDVILGIKLFLNEVIKK